MGPEIVLKNILGNLENGIGVKNGIKQYKSDVQKTCFNVCKTDLGSSALESLSCMGCWLFTKCGRVTDTTNSLEIE
jgi:hypothetical protein